MKITNLKKMFVACVATYAFIGIQNSTVEAITQNRVVQEESIWQPVINDLKQGTDVQGVELMQISDKIKVKEKEMAKKEAASQQTSVTEKNATEAKSEKPEEVATPAPAISNQEKDLFARLVEAEAKGESFEGKVAVATIVLNRVESPEFPDTVTGVIKEVVGDAYAFTPVQNGEINNPASDEAKQAVDEALTNSDNLDGSVYFYNPEIATDDWIRSREVVETIGNHVFAK